MTVEKGPFRSKKREEVELRVDERGKRPERKGVRAGFCA